MVTLGTILLILVVVVITSVIAMKFSVPGQFTLEFHDGATCITSEITPAPMSGKRTLEIVKLSPAFTCEWQNASTTDVLFRKSAHRLFACPGDTFILQIEGVDSGNSQLTGVHLPEWNLKGTARSKVAFRDPIPLLSGTPYRLAMDLGKNNVRSAVFKIEHGLVLIQPVPVNTKLRTGCEIVLAMLVSIYVTALASMSALRWHSTFSHTQIVCRILILFGVFIGTRFLLRAMR